MASTPPPDSDDSPSSSLTLTYFADGQGRNGLIRLIFAVGNVPFEDEMIDNRVYAARRMDLSACPYGQLPTLTIDGTKKTADEKDIFGGLRGDKEVFGQSCSVARYAARVAGLYPSMETHPVDALRTDAIVDSWRDTLDLLYETVFTRMVVDGKRIMVPHHPSRRYRKLQTFADVDLVDILKRYEHMLVHVPGTDGEDKENYQFCTSVAFPSWADLAVYDLVKTMSGFLEKDKYDEIVSKVPLVVQMVERVDCLEGTKKHLSKYPYKDMSFFFERAPWWQEILHDHIMVIPLLSYFANVFVLPLWSKVITLVVRGAQLKASYTGGSGSSSNEKKSH